MGNASSGTFMNGNSRFMYPYRYIKVNNCQLKKFREKTSWPNLAVSIPRRPGLDSACVLARRVKIHPTPRKTLEKKHNYHHHFRCNFSQDLLAPGTHATGLRAPLRSPMPSLHSDSQVSSLRRNVWCDQSAVKFSDAGATNQIGRAHV